jgi:hypothetical protein
LLFVGNWQFVLVLAAGCWLLAAGPAACSQLLLLLVACCPLHVASDQ